MVEERTVRIFSGSYSGKENGVIIELFGRTEDGKSITLLYDDFRPYFKLVEPPLECIENLKKDDEIQDIKDEKLLVDGEKKDCKKIVCTFPWKVPGYRKRFKKKCKVLAADIPFIQRFFYDYDLSSTVKVKGEVTEHNTYTTDETLLVSDFEEEDPMKPELKILSFDIESSLNDDRILTIGCVIRGEGKTERQNFTGDELEIINDFESYIREKDPDVITGYNINGFDFPKLNERVDQLGKEDFNIGRDGEKLRKRGKRYWSCTGRIIADAWWSVKSETNLKRETLDHASNELLGKKKEDVDPSNIDEEWEKNPEKVKEYCVKDAELAYDILQELEVMDKAMDISTVSKLPVEEGLNPRTSTLVDSILIREAEKNDVGVPLTSHGKSKRGKIKGGYVHEVEAGLYDMVVVLDFKSMYPSIIIENNICPTTLSEEGSIEAPNSVRFLSKRKKEGLLPSILRDLMEERDSVKEQMKNADDKKTKEYYDGLQNAIKVIMNSFYGVMASSFYRFTNPKIGEAITGFARENIKTVIEKLEKNDLEVVYGDSLDYERKIIVKGPKGIEIVKIGKFVEEYDPSDYETLSMNLENGETEFKNISRGIKHRYDASKKGELLELMTDKGKTVVTPQHSVYTQKNNRPELVDAGELDVGDDLVSINELPGEVHYEEGDEIDLAQMISNSDEDKEVNLQEGEEEHKYIGENEIKAEKFSHIWKFDDTLAWILGYYCANGSVSDGKKDFISFESEDPVKIKKILNYFNEKTEKDLGIIEKKDETENKTYCCEIESCTITSIIVDGLGTGGKHEKKSVPEIIVNSEDKLKKEFLEGYASGNGRNPSKTSESNYPKLDSANRELTIGVNYLIKSIKSDKGTFGYDTNQVVWDYESENSDIHSLRCKKSQNEFSPARIKGISKVEPTNEYVYDIEVEGNHNFVDAEGNILVHNTDSVFFKSPHPEDIEKTIEVGEEVSEECTENQMILELEKIVDPLFTHGKKKRYVGKVVWPEDDILIRGYETRRSDSFEAQDESLQETFDYILGKDIDGAVEKAKERIQKVRDGKIDYEKLVISRSCKKYSSYKNPESMPNVQAAKKMEELGYKFTPGMKVSWIVTNAKKTPQEVEPWVPDHEFEKEPDFEYYARRIAKTLSRVTDVFGWDKEALLAGNKQSKLFSDQFKDDDGDDEENKKSKDKNIDKKEDVTLEDFV